MLEPETTLAPESCPPAARLSGPACFALWWSRTLDPCSTQPSGPPMPPPRRSVIPAVAPGARAPRPAWSTPPCLLPGDQRLRPARPGRRRTGTAGLADRAALRFVMASRVVAAVEDRLVVVLATAE